MPTSFLRSFFLPVLLCASATAQSGPIAANTLPDSPSAAQAMNAAQNASSALQGFSSSSTSVLPEEESGSLQNSQPTRPQAGPAEHEDKQTKRILGILPNFRSVSTDEHLPPLSVREKFVETTKDSFDYSAIVLPAALAGEAQARNSTPEFHQGMAGYGRYFWHNFVDQTQENYWVQFIYPVLTKEDPRYYTLGHGGFLKRTGYSLSRAVITRNDAGKETFNISEVFGAGTAAGVSTLYYPSRERSLGNVAGAWALNVGVDAFSSTLREFWPDINHFLFHDKQ